MTDDVSHVEAVQEITGCVQVHIMCLFTIPFRFGCTTTSCVLTLLQKRVRKQLTTAG